MRGTLPGPADANQSCAQVGTQPPYNPAACLRARPHAGTRRRRASRRGCWLSWRPKPRSCARSGAPAAPPTTHACRLPAPAAAPASCHAGHAALPAASTVEHRRHSWAACAPGCQQGHARAACTPAMRPPIHRTHPPAPSQERDTLAATAEGATRLRLKGGELAQVRGEGGGVPGGEPGQQRAGRLSGRAGSDSWCPRHTPTLPPPAAPCTAPRSLPAPQKEAELQSLLMGAKMRVNSLLGAAQGSGERGPGASRQAASM